MGCRVRPLCRMVAERQRRRRGLAAAFRGGLEQRSRGLPGLPMSARRRVMRRTMAELRYFGAVRDCVSDAAARQPAPAHVDRPDRAGRRATHCATHSAAPVIRSEMIDAAAFAAAASNDADRGRQPRATASSFVVGNGDDATEHAARLIALFAKVASRRGAAADPAVAGHQRRAASRGRRRCRAGRRCAVGLWPGADQRDAAAVAASRRPGTIDGRGRARRRDRRRAGSGKRRNRDRLDRGRTPRAALAARSAAALGRGRRPLALTAAPQGGLDGLGWQLAEPRPPGPGEVLIDVHAAGLNFRDMMWAMGLLPEEALIDGFAGPTFGLECAGIVRAVGAGVDGSRGRRPGGRLRPRGAQHPGDDGGACRDPAAGRHQLCRGGDDPGHLRHRGLLARHTGQARTGRIRADPCGRRRRRPRRDPVRQVPRRVGDRHRRIRGQARLSAPGRRRSRARFARSRLCRRGARDHRRRRRRCRAEFAERRGDGAEPQRA